MPLSTLVAFLDAENAPAALQTASQAARALEAAVDVVAIKPEPMDVLPYLGERITGDYAARIVAAAAESGDAAAAAAREAFAVSPLAGRATFVERVGDAEALIAEDGRHYGLIVLPAPLGDGANADRIAAALFETGRPTLVAPPEPMATIGEQVAIFWKSSPQAAKAVWTAMPFLRQAKTVKAFAVGDDAAASVEKLVEALGRAGVTAEGVPLAAGGDPGDLLLDAAVDMDADLLVMGAYSHNRLKELIFGGVTQHILESVGRPVFMAH